MPPGPQDIQQLNDGCHFYHYAMAHRMPFLMQFATLVDPQPGEFILDMGAGGYLASGTLAEHCKDDLPGLIVALDLAGELARYGATTAIKSIREFMAKTLNNPTYNSLAFLPIEGDFTDPAGLAAMMAIARSHNRQGFDLIISTRSSCLRVHEAGRYAWPPSRLIQLPGPRRADGD